MKSLLLLTLAIFAFASPVFTDVQNPKTNADDVLFLSSSSFECNLYIEKAGQALLNMANAEEQHNLSAVSASFILFLDESNRAIAICRDISTSVANDLVEVQTNTRMYYKLAYRH